MASIFVDRFDRPDNTDISAKAPMGVGYTEVTSDTQIVSGKLKAIGLTTHRATLDVTMNSADYYVQSIIKIASGSGCSLGLMGRFVDSNNYYRAHINSVSQLLILDKIVAGVKTELGTYAGGYAENTDYTLKLQMTGTTIKAFVNGTERISVTDSALTAAGKPGFYTDYGNGTWNDFVVSGDFTITPPTITTNYAQPGLERTKGWAVNSIDIQVVTKSENWNQDQTKRLNEFQAIKNLGANYVAMAVPYDNLTKYADYVTDARTKGFKIIHRSHWDAWEGDNSIPVGLSRQDYLTGIYHFIVNNPTLFADGDLFGACVECSNANDHGNYTFRTPENSGGSFTISKYNQFLKDQVAYANAAFAAIGKSVATNAISLSLSLLDLDGQVLDSGDGGNSSGLDNDDIVQYLGGKLPIDHYLSDAYRATSGYGAKLSSDLDKIHTAFPDCKIFYEEWGYHTITSVTDQEQYNVYREVLEVLASKPYVIGVNLWAHMGLSTASIFTDSGGTINANGRLCTQAIKHAFNSANKAFPNRSATPGTSLTPVRVTSTPTQITPRQI